MRRAIAGLAGAIVIVLWCWFVWPTPYRYGVFTGEGMSRPVRFNRVTGVLEAPTGAGWRVVHR